MSRQLEIELEKRIAAEAVKGLLSAGFTVGVNDGEETVVKRSTDEKIINEALFSTDEDYLLAYDATTGKKVGWVLLIWGNVDCLISDYTTNLEAALAGANAIADKYH